MRSPADIIYTWLNDQNALSNWPTFVSFLPDTADKAICIYDTAGVNNGLLMETGERIDHPGIQIFIRSTDYLEAYEKADSLATMLDQARNILIAVNSDETYSLHNATRAGTIIPLGIEIMNDKRRHQFTINAVLTLSLS